MNKLRSHTLLITIVAILLVLVIALWKQNTGLKQEEAAVIQTEKPISPEERTTELEALQQQLSQLLELKESLE